MMIKVNDEKALARAVWQAAWQWYQNPENRKKVEEYKRENNKQENDKQENQK